MIALFVLLGIGLKFVDDAFDRNLYSKKIATIFTFLVGILWIFLSLTNIYIGTILTAVLLGSLLAGKIDNSAFQATSGFVLLFFFFSGITLHFALLVFLTLVAALDEWVHDRSVIFKFRPLLKLAVLALIHVIPASAILAFFAFDISYDITGFLTQKISSKKRLAITSYETA
ncbi:hypothetical protein BMS3Bbin15_00611 [archaeon BMS3Bbin15]|nr:hypothetical protein BMS3Bbin15_00611 [archaeon BMS3Bbin15]